jgi:sugar phosphate isomerase/epimerase
VTPTLIERTAAKYGVQIANLGTYPGRQFADPDRPTRHRALSEMTRTIDLASRFGARSIRVMPGQGEDPKLIGDLVMGFQQSSVYAAGKGIYLGMENHAGSIAGHPDLAVQLCERVGSAHFGILYEPCNLLHGGLDYKEAFEVMKDSIVHVHLKDGAWVGESFERRHLGEGDVDVRWVVEALEGIGYEGDYALEYEICDIEPVETGLRKWYEFFEGL